MVIWNGSNIVQISPGRWNLRDREFIEYFISLYIYNPWLLMLNGVWMDIVRKKQYWKHSTKSSCGLAQFDTTGHLSKDHTLPSKRNRSRLFSKFATVSSVIYLIYYGKLRSLHTSTVHWSRPKFKKILLAQLIWAWNLSC